MRGLLFKPFVLSLLLAAGVCAQPAGHDDPPPATRAAEIDALIEQLADPSFAVREAAGQRLLETGAAARLALLEATESDNPELAGRARALLRRLPWHTADDPAPVKEALRRYSLNTPDGSWAEAVTQLRSTKPGQMALLRLLRGELDPGRRWMIAWHLKALPKDATLLEALRTLEAEGTNAPALWLAGSAWLSREPQKAIRLMARSADVELAEAVRVPPERGSKYLLDDLQKLYERTGQIPAAADLLRRWHEAHPNQTLTDILFAFHANYPGLPKFQEDLRRFERPLTSAITWYTNARFVERAGFRTAAELLRVAAGGISAAAPAEGSTPQRRQQTLQARRYQVGTFLLERRWPAAAERELRAVLALADSPQDVYAVNVHFRLAAIAGGRGDDATAAAEYEKALNGWNRAGGLLTAESDGEQVAGDDALLVMRSIMHRYGLRAAQKAKSQEELIKHATALVELGKKGRHGGVKGNDPDLAIDAVTALREAGQPELASKLFDQAYTAAKSLLELHPNDPQRMNTLAWLCARCGERLDEAEALMNKALQLAPENPAYIDTSAEVQFQRGNFDKAVQIQERALKLAPNAQELKDQMARFKAGLAAAATKPSQPAP